MNGEVVAHREARQEIIIILKRVNHSTLTWIMNLPLVSIGTIETQTV